MELGIRTSDLSSPDLLAEAAFELFRISCESCLRTRDVIEDESALFAAWAKAEQNISMHRRIYAQPCPRINSADFNYLLSLGRRYDALKEIVSFDGYEFSPKLQGCGVLGLREADISAGDFLVEVKTVDRNFNSKDIRQVIIYLALDFLSGQRRWTSAIMFNPRRSFVARFNPAQFIGYVSAGRSESQVYRDIESFLLHRDFHQEQFF
jgi:hypothetical protein